MQQGLTQTSQTTWGVVETSPAKPGTVLGGDTNGVIDMRMTISLREEHDACDIPQVYHDVVSAL